MLAVKNSTWKRVAMEANANTSQPRWLDQFKSKYENLKNKARKYAVEQRHALIKTSRVQRKMLSIINKKTVYGEDHSFDDDTPLENHPMHGLLFPAKVSLTKSDERINSHLKDNDNVENIMRTCVFEEVSDNEYNEGQWKEQPNPEFLCRQLNKLQFLNVPIINCSISVNMDGATNKKNPCCVPNCKDKTSQRHWFPTNELLLERWLDNMNRQDLKLFSFSEVYNKFYVCQTFCTGFHVLVVTHMEPNEKLLPEKSETEPVKFNEIVERVQNSNTVHVSNVVPVRSTSRCLSPCILPIEHCETPMSRCGILKELNVTWQIQLSPRCRRMYQKCIKWGQKSAL
ncbi:hypothetical protein FQA39_LY15595 [Lamprigera yunnana]|nr:hypothetical protein FQA39_LY15595 [Lamprigera yunnana]